MVVIGDYPQGRKDPGFSILGVDLSPELFNILSSWHHATVGRQKGILKSLDHLLALDALFLFVKFYEGDEIVRHDLLIVLVWRRKRAGRGNPLSKSVKSCSVGVAIGLRTP